MFVCEVPPGVKAAYKPQLNDEHREARWWPLAALPARSQLHPVVVRPHFTTLPTSADTAHHSWQQILPSTVMTLHLLATFFQRTLQVFVGFTDFRPPGYIQGLADYWRSASTRLNYQRAGRHNICHLRTSGPPGDISTRQTSKGLCRQPHNT